MDGWRFVPVGNVADNRWKDAQPRHWILENVIVRGPIYHGGYVYNLGGRELVPALVELNRIVAELDALPIYALSKSMASDYLMDWFTKLRIQATGSAPVRARFDVECNSAVLARVRTMTRRIKSIRMRVLPLVDALDRWFAALPQ